MSRRPNQIRIIAGQWRGRRLPVADLPGLRPTTDRVRETVFNWLMHDIPGARCLDLFAGSGALGLECVSRGASFVQLVESHRVAAQSLQQVLAGLKIDNDGQAVVQQQDALALIKTPPSNPFDIVFVDPPFANKVLDEVVADLDTHHWLANNAKIYVERSARDESDESIALPDSWVLLRSKAAGESAFSLYQKAEC